MEAFTVHNYTHSVNFLGVNCHVCMKYGEAGKNIVFGMKDIVIFRDNTGRKDWL